MPSLSLPRRAGGGSRRRGGIAGPLALFLLVTLAATVIATVVIADRRAPEITEPKANEIAPQLDQVQPGASEQRVRAAFGQPDRVLNDQPGGRCLYYTNLPSNQPAYRFCFEGGRLQVISPQ